MNDPPSNNVADLVRRCVLALSFVLAGQAVGCGGCSRGPVLNKEDIPQLNFPIAIVDGDIWADGGSVTVSLRGSSGEQIDLAVGQRTFPQDEYEPGCLYVGTLDELHNGQASLCPKGSAAAYQIIEYLEDAIRNADPCWSVNDSDFDDDDWPLSSAQRILKFLKKLNPTQRE